MRDFWLAWYVVFFTELTHQEKPQRITSCSCRYKNLTYDLSPLAMTNHEARFTCNASPGFKYSYNPCLSFTLPNQTGSLKPDNCTKVAMCRWSDGDSNYHKAYGYQNQMHCVIRDGKVALRYKYDQGLYSFVELICNKSQTDVKSAFKWISGSTEPVFQVNHKYSCPRESPSKSSTQRMNVLKDVWFWIALGESIILFVIIIIVIITCACRKRPVAPDNNGHDVGVHEPLLNPAPPVPQGNPYHQPPIAPHDNVIPENVIAPPDEFNAVQPPRAREDEPAPVMNEGDQNNEQRREEAEPRNEPINGPDLGNDPPARPDGQRNENRGVLPERNGSDVQRGSGNRQPGERRLLPQESRDEPGQHDQAIGGSDEEQEGAPHQGAKVPVERSATSDEDSMPYIHS